MPSVTTVLGLLDDGKSNTFPWASAGIAAVQAVHYPESWTELGTNGCTHDKTGFCPACKFLRSEFDRRWKAKATLGTHVHHLCESMAQGDEVDQDDVVEPYLDAFESFLVACQPKWLHQERTIRYDDGALSFRGQVDGIADLIDPATGTLGRWMLDLKSGHYSPKTQALQLSAYRHATTLTRWDDDGEHEDGRMPAVEHAGVVLLDDGAGWYLKELPTGPEVFDQFLHLRSLHNWSREMDQWDKYNPLKAEKPEAIKEGAGV